MNMGSLESKVKEWVEITLQTQLELPTDLLPALKGERFPPSIRGYICHLRGSRGGQSSPHLYVVANPASMCLGATKARTREVAYKLFYSSPP